MNDLSSQSPEFFRNSTKEKNLLWQYVQALDSDQSSRLSQPTREAVQIMERNIMGLLGGLPDDHFDVSITTNREQLGRLLASAMVSGYFLHNAEQRMGFEKQWTATETEEEMS